MKHGLIYPLFVLLALLGVSKKAVAQTSALYGSAIESTADAPVWYFIQSGEKNVLELPASGNTVAVVASPLTKNSDGMFWRFEKNTDGTYKLINKARSGSVNADLAWDDASNLSVTISAVSGTSYWSISNSGNYFSAATTTGITATTTAPTSATLASQFAFVKAPIAGADNNDLFYQMKSGRTASATYLYLNGTAVAWYSTNNTALPVQLFQFKKGDEGYFMMKNASVLSSNITVGTLGVAGNITAGTSTSTQFFFNPRLDGYVVLNIKGQASTVAIDYNGIGTCGFYTGRTFTGANTGLRFAEAIYATDPLSLSISDAELQYSQTAAGINPGQYTAQNRQTLQDAIAAAKVVKNNPVATEEEKSTAISTLNAATAVYLASMNIVQISTEGNEHWYYIKSPRGITADQVYAENQGVGKQILNKLKSANDAQLWKVVANGTGYAFVNKLDGSYMNTDGANNTTMVAQTGVPAKAIVLKNNGKDASKTDYYLVENEGATVSFRMHAANAGFNWGLMNYTGSASDNCSFLLLTYDPNDVLGNNILTAETLYSKSLVGTNPGNFTAEVKATFRAAIDAAIAINNNAASTTQQKLDAANALTLAQNNFVDSYNTIKLSTPESDVWYYIVSAGQAYCNGQTITNTSSTAGSSILFTPKSVDPNKLWRFVDAGNGQVAIQNRASGLYISANPRTSGSTDTAIPFNVKYLGESAQFSFNADNESPLHAQEAGTLLVTWAGGLNTASAWTLSELPAADNNLPVAISSVSLKQGITTTGIGNVNQPLAYASVNVSGLVGTVKVKSVSVDLTGTTNFNAVKSLKLYATNSDIRLKPAVHTLLSTIENPGSGAIEMTLAEPFALPMGTSNLFLAADIADNAKEGDVIDVRLLSVKNSDETLYTLTSNTTPYATTVFLSQAMLFSPGDAGSQYYRIPAIVTAQDGSLVTATDRRNNSNGDLPGDIDIVIRRSTDNGKSWSDANMIAGQGTTSGYGDAAMVVDKSTGKIFCFFAAKQGFFSSTSSDPIRVAVSESDDNGLTWSAPKDITSMIYGAECSNAISKQWLGGFIASGRALQLRSGRLIFAMAVRDGSAINNYVVYSDDHGLTWTPNTNAANSTGGDEAKLAERNDGSVIISVRNGGTRKWNVSPDGGLTWGTVTNNSYLKDPACNGEIMTYTSTVDGYEKNRMLHSLCYATDRSNVSMLLSYDEGVTFPTRKTICPSSSAYSTFTVLSDGTIGMYYEDGALGNGYDMVYVRFSLDWLTGGVDTYKAPSSTGITKNKVAAITVLVENGTVVVKGSECMPRVFNLAGVEMNAANRLAAGVYIVKVDNYTTKVVVK